MNKIICLISIFCLGFSNRISAQSLTNEGTDFWVAFTEMHDATAAIYEINISSRTATSGTVEIIGYWSVPFTVVPGFVTTVTIPPIDAHNPFSEVVIDRAIHVSSLAPITVYASTFHLYRSEASVCLPSPSLGSDYMISTYPNRTIGGLFESEFVVVCGPSPVQVEIVPSCLTAGGVTAGTPIIVDLVPGEFYLVQAAAGALDLTGSTIKATDGVDKFVVFNGQVWAHLQVGACTQTTADPLYEIAYPTPSWGYEYIALLSADQSVNKYRVVALNDGTDIFLNGVFQATINAGNYYDGQLTAIASYISTSEPVTIVQAMVTGGCSATNTGDPSIIILNSNEQMYLDTVTFYAVEYNGLDTNYCAMVTRTTDIGTIEFNDVPLLGWTPVPFDPTYSYKIFGIDTGSHTAQTTGCGFLAYTYGSQWAESYFYAAGVRVNSIDDSISFTSLSTSASGLCDVDSIQFTPFTSGGTVESYDWDFGDGGTSTLDNPIHEYPGAGTYTVTLIVVYQCQTDTIVETLTIYESPTHTTVENDITCYDFDDGSIDITVSGGTPGYTYSWTPGGATTEDISSLGPGTYTITITDANGCTSIETITITEPPELTANIIPAGPFLPIDPIYDLTQTGSPGGTWTSDCGPCVDPVTGEFDPSVAGNGIWTVCYTVGVVPCDVEDCITIIVSDSCAYMTYWSDPSCFGFSDGSATINVSGGSGVITFTITNSAGTQVNVGNSNTANSLTEGWYYFLVEDDLCSFWDSVYIDAPEEMQIDLIITEPLCYGDTTGYVEVDTVLNPRGDYDELSFYWTPNPNGVNGLGCDTMPNAPAGTYNLLVNDENGCAQSVDFVINQPDELFFVELGYEPAYCRLFPYQSGNGVVFAAAGGGTPDYTYEWQNVYELTTSAFTTWGGLNPGVYEITVVDDNGCTLVQKITLDSLNPIADFEMTSAQFTSNYQGTSQVNVHFVNQSLNFANPNDPLADTTFFWNFDLGEGWLITHDYYEEFDRSYKDSGTYIVCLVAQNKNGCTDTTCKDLIVFDKPILVTPNIFTPNGDGINDMFFFPNVAMVTFNCTVVNRWGETIFVFDSIDDQWNGNDKSGDKCTDGVYFYKYEGVSTNKTQFEGQGFVELLRGQ